MTKRGFGVGAALAFLMATSAGAAVPVTNYGAYCNGTGNDTAAIQAAINASPNDIIQLPAAGDCIVTGTITIPTNVGFNGNGAVINGKGVPSGSAVLVVKSTNPGVNYGGNVEPYTNINIFGAGKSSGATGLLVEASDWSVTGLNVNGFKYGVTFGNYSYLDTFYNFQIFANQVGVYYPYPFPVDSGEEISFHGGAIFNSPIGVQLNGGEFNFDDTSFDFDTQPIINNNGGLRIMHGHIEHFNVAPVQMSWNVNAWVHTTITDTDFLTDQWLSLPLISTTGGYAQFKHVFLGGFSNSTGLVTGPNAANVSLCDITSGNGPMDNVPNVGRCG